VRGTLGELHAISAAIVSPRTDPVCQLYCGVRDLRAVGVIDPAVGERLAPATRFDSLEDLLTWNHDLVEIIVQDEFTHDVILRAAPAFLVFDTT
jgi:hypothetical protein